MLSDKVYLNVDGAKGERFAFMLSEALRSGSPFADSSTRVLLSKVSKAVDQGEIGIRISPREAQNIIEISERYLEDYPSAPFEKSKTHYGRSFDTTSRLETYPKMVEELE